MAREVFVGEEIRWSNNEHTDAQRFDNTQSLGIQVRPDQLGGRRVLQAAVNGRAFSVHSARTNHVCRVPTR